MAAGDADGADRTDARRRVCQQGEAGLVWLADRQLCVVSQAQLYELGFSEGQVRRRVAQGRLHPRFRHVYSVGSRRLVPRAHLLAALLSLGPRAFLSHRTAAAVWGLRAINTQTIEVTVPGQSRRSQPGLVVHRTENEPHERDVRPHAELRVSSVLRMLAEVAPGEIEAELGRLVTVAVQKGLLRPDARDGRAAIDAALSRHARRPGMPKLAAVLAVYLRTDSSKSELERAFDRMLARHPEIPEPQRNVHIGGWEIDRWWPEQRLVVELDGRPYHLAARDMERDRIKDVALHRLGVTPLRVTDFRFEHDQPGILDDLRYFLCA